MNKWMPYTLSLAMLMAYKPPAAAQSADLTGEWEVSLKTPIGEYQMTASLKQEGQNISGEVRGEFKIESSPVEGTLRGKDFRAVSTWQSNSQKPIKLTLTGELDGNSLKGKADIGGFVEGVWTANRLSTVATSAKSGSEGGTQSGQNADVSGTWSFEVETPTAASYPSFTFRQEGVKVTGVGKGAFGEAVVLGTIKGGDIVFSFKVETQGMEVPITYSGTVEKDLMKGTVVTGEAGSGIWIARRSITGAR